MRILPAFIRSLAAAVLGCLLLAPAALAAGNFENQPLNLPDQSGQAAQKVGAGGGSIVRTIVGLAVVIGVIYGLYWVLKQVKASKESSASGAGLTTLASLSLGTNRSLHLVRAGDEVVLVGSGEAGVTPIRSYTEDEARALGLLDEEPFAGLPAATNGTPSFSVKRVLDEMRSRTVRR